MPVKREIEEEYYNSEQEEEFDSPKTPPQEGKSSLGKSTPSPKKARPTPPKKPAVSTTTVDSDGLSAKAKYAIMIIQRGIEVLKKDEVEAATGLNGNQQRDLTRKDGKGWLRKALMGIAENL
ncbi:uncharacterized protein L201_000676 [Kwoniella dendrophila CBS 6074]|uniref:Uncharacterized protein n=1 Tax=Kwoniella dendrophila CBS 6074 TaxID=1295534 RepID=A0AAX4JM17_9TREE